MRTHVPSRAIPIVSPSSMLPVQVARRTVIARDVVSLALVLPGTDQAPAPYLPGQFVTLAVPAAHETLYRPYSLCSDGDASQPWEITVKRIRMGAASSYFFSHVDEGTLLYASLPQGTFTLPRLVHSGMFFVFVAVGSGIAPIMGMLRALAARPLAQRPLVQLHYASHSGQDIIFADELADLDPEGSWLWQRHYLSSHDDQLTVPEILACAGSKERAAHWYICGPEPLKVDLQALLCSRGVPEKQIHSELFISRPGPAYRVPPVAAGVGSIHVAETGEMLDIQPNETLLTALERHGYRPHAGCRVGSCGECALQVTAGTADSPGGPLTARERAAGYVLSCVARPTSAITIATAGRPPASVSRHRPRLGAIAVARAVAVAGMAALLLGSWNLTNHRPANWPASLSHQAAMQTSSGRSAITAPPKTQAPTPVVSTSRNPHP